MSFWGLIFAPRRAALALSIFPPRRAAPVAPAPTGLTERGWLYLCCSGKQLRCPLGVIELNKLPRYFHTKLVVSSVETPEIYLLIGIVNTRGF